jgi:hypothetical protein
MLKFTKFMRYNNGGGYDVSVLDEFENLTQVKFLDALIANCQNKDNLTWYKNPHSVGEICERMEISANYVDKLLKQLKKLNVLHNPNRGVYIISKRYVQVKEDPNAR